MSVGHVGKTGAARDSPVCAESQAFAIQRLSRTGTVWRAFPKHPAAADVAGVGVVESILDGRAADVMLPKLLEPFPLDWSEQSPALDCG
jgi:hypothetical protein